MTLLDAVNTVLPYLGSHVVTRLENTKHPTVSLVLSAIERQRKSLITKGWWFNKVKEKLPVNTDGRITVPTYCISLYGLNQNVEMQGSYLFDLDNNTRYFKNPVEVKMVKDTTFEELPHYAQMVVTYQACLENYVQDYGLENSTQLISQIIADNLRDLEQEDIRKNKRNITSSYANRFKSMRRPFR